MNKTIVETVLYEYKAYPSWVTNVLDNIIEEVKPYDGSLYLYGSLATNDYCEGWSDVDALFICDKGLPLDVSARIFQQMKLIDPLQHHNLLTMTTSQIENYNFKLPIEALKDLVCLFGNPILMFGHTGYPIRKHTTTLDGVIKTIDSAFSEGVMNHHRYFGVPLLDQYRNSEDAMYQLKYYLGLFVLIPSLYLHAQGKPTHKRKAIEIAPTILSPEFNSWLYVISSIRKDWTLLEGRGYTPNKIPLWVKERIPKDYFEIGARLVWNLM